MRHAGLFFKLLNDKRNFVPQLWRPSLCAECFHKKEDHTNVILEEKILSKDEPTELFELVEKIGAGFYIFIYFSEKR